MTIAATIEGTIPAQAGIGLRTPHYHELLNTQPEVAWLEVHSENFFASGGAIAQTMDQVRQDYPISLHGVGLSIGSTDALNSDHLDMLKDLIDRCDPGLVSEHLCWCSVGGRYANDLLPLPYTEEALQHMSARIKQVQDFIGRQILIENVSSYLQFTHSVIPEWEFISAVAERSGCGLLVDINNIYVNSVNHGFDAYRYLDALPSSFIGEFHLAGFATDNGCLIDTHGSPVSDPVWELYSHALRRFGNRPTLIEWDTDIPSLDTLLREAAKAERMLERNVYDAA